jgi:hypothetical protein
MRRVRSASPSRTSPRFAEVALRLSDVAIVGEVRDREGLPSSFCSRSDVERALVKAA